MYRYRKTTAVSRDVLDKFQKHRDKLGTIVRVAGKRFRSQRKGFAAPVSYEVCMVYGTRGTARLDGCCWGYGGEGPRAVRGLLLACGVPGDVAENLAFRTTRRGDNELGVDWEVAVA